MIIDEDVIEAVSDAWPEWRDYHSDWLIAAEVLGIDPHNPFGHDPDAIEELSFE